MIFRGRSLRSLDAKGRLLLPPGFRESLAARGKKEDDSLFALTTYDKCLVAFPWPDWEEMEEKFSRIFNPAPDLRSFRRQFIGSVEVQNFDAQGRILLSQQHRNDAGLGRDALVVGMTNHFEIWNPDLYAANIDAMNVSNAMAELAASGISFAL
jgi:MraZ protein